MEFQHLVQHARTHSPRRPPGTGRGLAAGQSPTALFTTCAGSRIVTADSTGAEPGGLFEPRAAGDVTPAHEPDPASGEIATTGFAVVRPAVAEVVVRGHPHRGAALHPGRSALDHLPATRLRLASRAGFRPLGSPAPRAEGQRHVLDQPTAPRDHPFAREHVEPGVPRPHGWFHHIETGEVPTHRSDLFQPL